MHKSLEQIAATKAGSSEYSEQQNPAGMYVFDRGDEFPKVVDGQEIPRYDRIPVIEHPKFGTVQADAYIRVGYKWERELTAEEKMPRRLALDPVVGAQATGPAMVPAAQLQEVLDRLQTLEGASKTATPSEKPMSLWNKSQLLEKAAELGLQVEEDSTNKEILELIKSAI